MARITSGLRMREEEAAVVVVRRENEKGTGGFRSECNDGFNGGA